MNTALAGITMTPQSHPPDPQIPVKMSKSLHRKAKMVALDRDMELYEYLDKILRPAIERDHKRLFSRGASDEDAR